ncbi:hypothetical protein OCU04_009964 [Sclerotinia nivalis]|uniref:Uncharacterized protein n=1 Tax=Sclerotinia nivalis TaxID=352851 RepID=A0A9X0AH70_9HELO|nr:hypothetical protein OCU04_009964 [Sclerotinia nivalis]
MCPELLPENIHHPEMANPFHDSSVETESVEVPLPSDEVPNGGFLAWLHVAGSWCIFVNTWGIINTYGVYQKSSQANLLSSESESTFSWIGSVQAALLYIIGAAAGPIFDAGHMRALIWSGAILSVLGMMLTSIAKTYCK